MKNVIRSKKMLKIAGAAMLVAAVAVTLVSTVFFADAAGVPKPGEFRKVQGMFFPNPHNTGTFDVNPKATPVINRGFPLIYFNPSTSMQSCSNKTGVNETTRPFTDVSPQADGSCKLETAHDKDMQAGVGKLKNFEAVFTATITVDKPRQISFKVVADDGWILSMGSNAGSAQPTYVSGPMNNAPKVGPFTGYTVMGANNKASAPLTSTVVVNFSAAGTYPLELDYTEAHGGRLTLLLVPYM